MIEPNFQVRVTNIFNQWICIIPDGLQLADSRLPGASTIVETDTLLLLWTVIDAQLWCYIQKAIIVEYVVIKVLQPEFNSR